MIDVFVLSHSKNLVLENLVFCHKDRECSNYCLTKSSTTNDEATGRWR